MLKTPLCDTVGIEYPIFSVSMGTGAGPELVAAVSSAGACGVLGTSRIPASLLRQRIQRVRALTDKPSGANRILAHPQEGQIEVCFDERVPLLILFWGDPTPYVNEAHRRGMKVFIQVGSVEEATSAAEAGVDAIIAQGVEAGGHVRSTISLSTLVPAVVEAVKPVPVRAVGGLGRSPSTTRDARFLSENLLLLWIPLGDGLRDPRAGAVGDGAGRRAVAGGGRPPFRPPPAEPWRPTPSALHQDRVSSVNLRDVRGRPACGGTRGRAARPESAFAVPTFRSQSCGRGALLT